MDPADAPSSVFAELRVQLVGTTSLSAGSYQYMISAISLPCTVFQGQGNGPTIPNAGFVFFLVCSCHSKLKIEISIRKKNSAESLPSVPTSVVVPVSGAAGGVFYTHLTWAAPDVGSVQNYNIYRSDNGGVFKLIGISTTTSFDDSNSGTSSAATYPSLGDLSTWVTSNDNCGNIQTGQLNTARSGASAFIISNGGFGFGGTNVALIGGLSNGANFLSDMECKTL